VAADQDDQELFALAQETEQVARAMTDPDIVARLLAIVRELRAMAGQGGGAAEEIGHRECCLPA
jgi:hypothetical protein